VTILYFDPIPKKLLAIASGATPIRSADHAPDKNKKANMRKNSARRDKER
jgi:hypothetical protein